MFIGRSVHKNFFVYMAAGITALGGFLFGYDTGVISGAILFIKKDFLLSTFQIEIVISAVLLGAVIGAACAGVLSDRIGRRRLLLLVAALFTVAALLSALATNVIVLIIGRICVGVAIGAASMTSPLYIAEISPSAIRGRLVSLSQFAVTFGIVISYVIDYALADSGAWRWMLGIAAVPSFLLGIGMFFLPESPRWLVCNGFKDNALKILLSIHSKIEAHREIDEIQESAKTTKKALGQMMTPWLKRTLLIGIGLAIFQQLTGINTVIYYAPTIMESAGFGSAPSAILATAGIGVVNMLSTVVALWLLDKVGRRVLLLTGLVGMVVSLLVLGFCFLLPALSHILAWLTVACLMVYVASFAISLGPVFWLLISEIYPLKIRGKAMSVATIANWGSNMLVALTFLTLIQTLGSSITFWFYGVVGILAWFFCYFLVPETKKKTLEEIELQWEKLHCMKKKSSSVRS